MKKPHKNLADRNLAINRKTQIAARSNVLKSASGRFFLQTRFNDENQSTLATAPRTAAGKSRENASQPATRPSYSQPPLPLRRREEPFQPQSQRGPSEPSSRTTKPAHTYSELPTTTQAVSALPMPNPNATRKQAWQGTAMSSLSVSLSVQSSKKTLCTETSLDGRG